MVFHHPATLTLLLVMISVAAIGCGLWLDDEARIERARVALDNQQYSAAIIDLKSVLRSAPDNGRARSLLGRALAANQEFEAAEIQLQKALDLGRSVDEFRVALAQTWLATGQPERAVQIADPTAATGNNETFLLWLYRGDAQAALGAMAAALRSYEKARGMQLDNETALLRAANLYWSSGNLRDARVFTEAALSEVPDSIDAQLTLAAILLDLGNPQAAEQALNRALAAPQLDLVERGSFLVTLVQAHLAQGDVDAARNSTTLLSGLRPADDPDLRLLQTKVALAEGDNDTAAAELLAYLVDFPDSEAALRMLGTAHFRLGMINSARARLVSALRADPEHVETRNLLARVYLLQERTDRASAMLERTLELAPQDPTTLSLLGLLDLPTAADGPSGEQYALTREQLIRGKIDQALAASQRQVRDNPDDPRALNNLGLCQLANGQMGPAVQSLSQAVAAMPDDAYYRLNLARAHLGNSTPAAGLEVLQGAAATDLAAAIRVARRALLINQHERGKALGRPDPGPLLRWLSEAPDDTRARAQLAETYMATGSFAKAAAQYELLLKQGLDDAGVYNNLAWSYLHLGDDRAREKAEYAYHLAPNDGAVLDTLGWILVSEGELERGLSLLRDAHILHPSEHEIAYHLADALIQTGHEDEAGPLLQRVLESAVDPLRTWARELLAASKRRRQAD